MTRINSAIPVNSLTDEHLLAEHREIKRLSDNLHKAIKSGSINKIPNKFCLGTGHVMFFLNKFSFTFERYYNLHTECLRRGFYVQDYSSNWKNIPYEYYRTYTPTENERTLLIARITERITESKKPYFHYEGKVISKTEAIELLNK